MNDIITVISSVGFPIAACLAMGFFVKYQMDHYNDQIKDVTQALNNNTIALTKLCDKLGDD